MVLETTHRTATGTAVVVDALAMGDGNRGHALGQERAPSAAPAGDLCRGEVEIELEYVPRPEYGLVLPLLDAIDGGLAATGGADVLILSCPVPPTVERSSASARLVLREGEQVGFALHHGKRADPGEPRVWCSPRSRRDWTTQCRHGSRGRSSTRPTTDPGASWSTTADGFSRRCRSNPRARSVPRRPRRCPRWSAAPATGTTATPGSGTPRSRSRRCGWRPAPTRRTSSSTTSPRPRPDHSSRPVTSRSCSGSAASGT